MADKNAQGQSKFLLGIPKRPKHANPSCLRSLQLCFAGMVFVLVVGYRQLKRMQIDIQNKSVVFLILFLLSVKIQW